MSATVGLRSPSPLDSSDQELTRHLDRAHVFHSWSAQASLEPLVIAGGLGSTVWDFEGTAYLDISSQLVNTNLGHQHPAVVAAIKEQADLLTTVAPAHANLTRGRAAQRILDHAGGEFSSVFFTNGGADANENAIRMARLYTGREKVLSTYRSYHGNTGSAIAATGDWRRIPNEYSRGHVRFFGPFAYRSEFWSDTPLEESARALHHLERVIISEGPSSIAAIVLETVPGTAGVLVPPPGYLAGVRRLADKHGIVLIFDEVMAGFGRTGSWFAFQALAEQGHVTHPDLITFAKGVNSGYVPAGGVIISPLIAGFFDERMFPGGLTYSGHPLAMAAIVGAIDAMQNERVVENAHQIGERLLGPGLAALAEAHPMVGDVRGLGVMWALDLVVDRSTREPVPPPVIASMKEVLLRLGVLPFFAENRLHVVPPCVATEAEIHTALAAIDEALFHVGHHYAGDETRETLRVTT